jgi:hypothetical protein
MDDEAEISLEELRNEIRAVTSRVLELSLRQTLLMGLGKSSEDTDRELLAVEGELIKMRASRDLLLFRLRNEPGGD